MSDDKIEITIKGDFIPNRWAIVFKTDTGVTTWLNLTKNEVLVLISNEIKKKETEK